jgi:hypothetical protein
MKTGLPQLVTVLMSKYQSNFRTEHQSQVFPFLNLSAAWYSSISSQPLILQLFKKHEVSSVSRGIPDNTFSQVITTSLKKLAATFIVSVICTNFKYDMEFCSQHVNKLCKISGYHGMEYEDDRFLGYCVV